MSRQDVITKLYLTGRQSTDNVVEYKSGMKLKVNVSDMIDLIGTEGAGEIKVFVADAGPLLTKRLYRLVNKVMFRVDKHFGFTKELSTLEDYATNYYVVTIVEDVSS